jgi:hypothetical protein
MARELCRSGISHSGDRNYCYVNTRSLGLRGTATEVNDSWEHSEFNIPQDAEDADHEPGDRAALDAQSSGGTPFNTSSNARSLHLRDMVFTWSNRHSRDSPGNFTPRDFEELERLTYTLFGHSSESVGRQPTLA